MAPTHFSMSGEASDTRRSCSRRRRAGSLLATMSAASAAPVKVPQMSVRLAVQALTSKGTSMVAPEAATSASM